MCKFYNFLFHLTIYTVDIFSFEFTLLYLILFKGWLVFYCPDEINCIKPSLLSLVLSPLRCRPLHLWRGDVVLGEEQDVQTEVSRQGSRASWLPLSAPPLWLSATLPSSYSYMNCLFLLSSFKIPCTQRILEKHYMSIFWLFISDSSFSLTTTHLALI